MYLAHTIDAIFDDPVYNNIIYRTSFYRKFNMLIKRSPRTLSRFTNASVSFNIDIFRDIALIPESEDITFEIFSDNVEGGFNLPEKKLIIASRQFVLQNAAYKNGPDGPFYVINLKHVVAPVKKTQYIVFEGEEGTGKTTMTKKLAGHLRDKGFSVLETKEPGTAHLPLTLALRKIMLDAQYEDQITPVAREFISQSIRSIHLEKLIYPAIENNTYDYIIQDRGILSGYAYGTACGNDIEWLVELSEAVSSKYDVTKLYDNTIYLTGNVEAGLSRALASKQEFEAGDAMEARGVSFIETVSDNFKEMSQWFESDTINVDDKSIDQVFSEILEKLELS